MSEQPARSSAARIRDAAVELLAEQGVVRTTTRAIAERAGVNEVTVFRQYASKNGVLIAALEHVTRPFRTRTTAPSENVAHDLRQVATGYAAFADNHPDLVSRVLPEIAHEPELRDSVLPWQQDIAARVRVIVEHHQAHGRLRADLPSDEIARAFFGPLAARAFLRHLFPVRSPLDVATYVELFLHGYQGGVRHD